MGTNRNCLLFSFPYHGDGPGVSPTGDEGLCGQFRVKVGDEQQDEKSL